MIAFTLALTEAATRAAAARRGAEGGWEHGGPSAVADRLDEALRRAEEITAFLGARLADAAAPPDAVRAAEALEARTAALGGAGRLLRGFLPLFVAEGADHRSRALLLVGQTGSVLDGVVRVAGSGRVPLGPDTDEIDALAWRSRGPDTASRLSRQSRMVAGAVGRWSAAAPPVVGAWRPQQYDEVRRYLREHGCPARVAEARAALAKLRARAAARR